MNFVLEITHSFNKYLLRNPYRLDTCEVLGTWGTHGTGFDLKHLTAKWERETQLIKVYNSDINKKAQKSFKELVNRHENT